MQKKLKNKCNKIHVGKNEKECPELKVHNDEMSLSQQEKYLGDILSNTGDNKANIQSRRAKGFGIVSEILSILKEVPLGKYKIQAGIKLRNSMFLNGILTNSEVWHGLRDEDLVPLEEVDEILLRGILEAHSKTPKEALYLETGTKPIRFVVKSRRLGYLYHLLTRKESELISKVFFAQKRKPIGGDWVKLVEDDMKLLDIKLNDNEIKKMKKENFKVFVKKQVDNKSFTYLQNLKEGHSKVKHIKYQKLEMQKYMKDSKFSINNIKLLFKLRTRMVQVKRNFKSAYLSLVCDLCKLEEDSQYHLLSCEVLLQKCQELYNDVSVEYDDLFSTSEKQLQAVKLFEKVLMTREKLLQEQTDQQ